MLDLHLSGKTALITGGSMGIGRACAEVLASEGCSLHLAARGEVNLEQTKADIEKQFDASVTIHSVDLSDGKNACTLARSCSEIDMLINNAGSIPGGDLWRIEEPRWRKAWDLKVFGYINLCRAVYSQMQSHGKGVIINIIGAAGERPTKEYIAGSSGNAALMAFTRALGGKSLRHNIRVIGINPGFIMTQRLEMALRSTAQSKLNDQKRWQELLPQDPPPGKPHDIANLVAFLGSDCARYISGTVITVDGGLTSG